MRRVPTGYGAGGFGGGAFDLRPSRGATILMGATVLLTLTATSLEASRAWLLLLPSKLPMPTALVGNSLVAAPGSLFNVVLFAAIAGFLFQDQVRSWWAHKRVELVLTSVGVLVGLYLLGTAMGVPGLGYGLGVSLLVLAWFGTAVERHWGMKRLLLFSLFVVLGANAVGGLLYWQWPSLISAATSQAGTPVNGNHALSDALLTAWCLMFGRRRLAVLNIEARKLVWVLVAINVLNFLFMGRIAALMGLTGIAMAWLLINGGLSPRALVDRFKLWLIERRLAKRRARFKVIDGGKTLHKRPC